MKILRHEKYPFAYSVAHHSSCRNKSRKNFA